jgi:RNA polymerase sigma-70 factor (ECF subfamily)
MAATQRGDARAYDELLKSIVPFIRALLRRQIKSPPQLEDVTQDVLLSVHRVLHTYNSTRPFTPWLAAIVARRGVDSLRRGGRINRLETQSDDLTATFPDIEANNALGDLDAERELEELLLHLPEAQRQALRLLKVRELSLAEASQVTGLSIGALKVSVHRAIKSLRAKVERDSASR